MANPNLTSERELAQTFITRGEARRLAHQLGLGPSPIHFFDAGQGDGSEIAHLPGGWIADRETREIQKEFGTVTRHR